MTLNPRITLTEMSELKKLAEIAETLDIPGIHNIIYNIYIILNRATLIIVKEI